jgi:transposase
MDVMALDVGSRKHAVAVSDARPGSCTEVANEVDALRRRFAALARKSSDCWVVMEATGVYHWQAATLAHAAGLKVAVLNPKVTSNVAKALHRRNKTRAVDVRALLQAAAAAINPTAEPPSGPSRPRGAQAAGWRCRLHRRAPRSRWRGWRSCRRRAA